jgi:hypothetical protein
MAALLSRTTPIEVTDEMVARAHNTLRTLAWNDLHNYVDSGDTVREAMRLALIAALQESS